MKPSLITQDEIENWEILKKKHRYAKSQKEKKNIEEEASQQFMKMWGMKEWNKGGSYGNR